jgi:hypothetical protein
MIRRFKKICWQRLGAEQTTLADKVWYHRMIVRKKAELSELPHTVCFGKSKVHEALLMSSSFF